MRIALEKKIIASFAVGLLLFLAISALDWYSDALQVRDAKLVQHSEEVQTELESLLAAVNDGETGMRGFVISGDESFLVPYTQYVKQIDTQYQHLNQLIANPGQRELLATLKPLLDSRGDLLAQVIDLRRNQGFEVARKEVSGRRGKALHDQIRVVIQLMNQGRRQLTAERRAALARAIQFSEIMTATVFLVGFGLFLLVLKFIQRDVANRAEATLVLARNNDELQTAKEHAQHAERVKSAFLATMSHELRTPLNSIVGFTGILMKELTGPLNAEQKKQLAMVRDSSRHLLALVNDMLDISKVEAGQTEVRCAPFQLDGLIDGVMERMAPLAQRRHLQLLKEVTQSLGEMHSDVRRIEQVLVNLLGNAIKFTPQGHVKLQVARVEWKGLKHIGPVQQAVRFEISDTGIGIQAKDFPNLFQPFQQLDKALSLQHEGTGLGLAISQRLVRLLGGEITVASTFGQGSTFAFTLPLQGTNKP